MNWEWRTTDIFNTSSQTSCGRFLAQRLCDAITHNCSRVSACSGNWGVALRWVTPPSLPQRRPEKETPHPPTLKSLCGRLCTCNRCARSFGWPCPPSCASPCGSETKFSPVSLTGSSRWRFRFFWVSKDTCSWKTPFQVPGAACLWKPCASSSHSVCGCSRRCLLEGGGKDVKSKLKMQISQNIARKSLCVKAER